jgi:hypothetical protein
MAGRWLGWQRELQNRMSVGPKRQRTGRISAVAHAMARQARTLARDSDGGGNATLVHGVENQWAIFWLTPFIGAFPLTPARSLGKRENCPPTRVRLSNDHSRTMPE